MAEDIGPVKSTKNRVNSWRMNNLECEFDQLDFSCLINEEPQTDLTLGSIDPSQPSQNPGSQVTSARPEPVQPPQQYGVPDEELHPEPTVGDQFGQGTFGDESAVPAPSAASAAPTGAGMSLGEQFLNLVNSTIGSEGFLDTPAVNPPPPTYAPVEPTFPTHTSTHTSQVPQQQPRPKPSRPIVNKPRDPNIGKPAAIVVKPNAAQKPNAGPKPISGPKIYAKIDMSKFAGRQVGNVVSVKTNHPRRPVQIDQVRRPNVKGPYNRSPSAALEIKPPKVGMGDGPGPLRKRLKNDPQSQTRSVIGPPAQSQQQQQQQQAQQQQGSRLNVPNSMSQEDLPYGNQYYNDSGPNSGPSPVSPQTNYNQEETSGNQWVNQGQSRISGGLKPVGAQSHQFRGGQSQNSAPQQQQQRRGVLADQLSQQPSSHRTLSSNSSQGDDGNWNSPQMAPTDLNKPTEGVMRSRDPNSQFNQNQFPPSEPQSGFNSVQTPANQPPPGQQARPDSRGQFSQFQSSKLDDMSPRPSPLDPRASPALVNQSRNNSSDMINSPYNAQKPQFQTQQPSPVQNHGYDNFSPQPQSQRMSRPGTGPPSQRPPTGNSGPTQDPAKVQSMNRTFPNQAQNRSRNLTPTNKERVSKSKSVKP